MATFGDSSNLLRKIGRKRRFSLRPPRQTGNRALAPHFRSTEMAALDQRKTKFICVGQKFPGIPAAASGARPKTRAARPRPRKREGICRARGDLAKLRKNCNLPDFPCKVPLKIEKRRRFSQAVDFSQKSCGAALRMPFFPPARSFRQACPAGDFAAAADFSSVRFFV